MRKIVSVYGSSKSVPGDWLYGQSVEMGRLLAEANYAVMTGGYGGVMEAVSKGANEAGGHVIGVTVAAWENSGFRTSHNKYIHEVIPHNDLTDRLLHLVRACDAAVGMYGGIGTISEVSLIWSFIQTGEVAHKPIILVGEWWQRWVDTSFGDGEYIEGDHLELLSVVPGPAAAVARLNEIVSEQ